MIAQCIANREAEALRATQHALRLSRVGWENHVEAGVARIEVTVGVDRDRRVGTQLVADRGPPSDARSGAGI